MCCCFGCIVSLILRKFISFVLSLNCKVVCVICVGCVSECICRGRSLLTEERCCV